MSHVSFKQRLSTKDKIYAAIEEGDTDEAVELLTKNIDNDDVLVYKLFVHAKSVGNYDYIRRCIHLFCPVLCPTEYKNFCPEPTYAQHLFNRRLAFTIGFNDLAELISTYIPKQWDVIAKVEDFDEYYNQGWLDGTSSVELMETFPTLCVKLLKMRLEHISEYSEYDTAGNSCYSVLDELTTLVKEFPHKRHDLLRLHASINSALRKIGSKHKKNKDKHIVDFGEAFYMLTMASIEDKDELALIYLRKFSNSALYVALQIGEEHNQLTKMVVYTVRYLDSVATKMK